jgi:ABC-2 type transport system ATP-binding protein
MSIVVRNLTKYFGETKALDNLSFQVKAGEIVGLLGPNGAGKTTTARIITGFLAPSSGTVEILGKDIQKYPYETRRVIGYLPEENPLYPDMDVIDYLEFVARLQDVPSREIPRRVKEVVRMFDLGEAKHKDIAWLSKGYRQRVGLALAMVHDPKVLILDEPTNGLDPNQIIEFRSFIAKLSRDKAVILSTHALPEVQIVCTRVVIIGRGKMLSDTPITELQKKYEGREGFVVEVEATDGLSSEVVQQKLQSLDNVQAVAQLQKPADGLNVFKFYLESKKNEDLRRDIYQACVRNNWTLISLSKQHVLIEEIFHQLTKGKPAG